MTIGVFQFQRSRSPAVQPAPAAAETIGLPLERGQVDAVGAAVLRLDDRGARVGRIEPRVEAVAAADVEAVAVRDAGAVARGARHAPVAVVLQAAADHVRVLHVGADLVELADRQVVAEQPRLAAVPRDRHAAVAADDQMVGVVGIDPQRVILGVDRAEHVRERLAAVVGDVEAAIGSEQVDPQSRPSDRRGSG